MRTAIISSSLSNDDLRFIISFHLFADQERLDYDTKKLQSFVKEKSFLISEKGALADKISPGIVKSLVSLTDKPK
jgi:hypothetical protein